MVTLEQVEKLRSYGDISYDEARKTLEETNGDLLEAVINLEKQGRIQSPIGDGYYSSKNTQQGKETNHENKYNKDQCWRNETNSFHGMMRNFFRWCGKVINKGNNNAFEVIKEGKRIIMIPVTALVVLILVTFWITVPVLIVGLFFGYRYTFNGPDLDKTQVNHVMDSVANAADNLKKEVKDHKGEKNNGENSNH